MVKRFFLKKINSMFNPLEYNSSSTKLLKLFIILVALIESNNTNSSIFFGVKEYQYKIDFQRN